MGTIIGYTAERMQAIEDGTVVDGAISGGHLILTKHDGSTIDAGSVVGPTGPTGPAGATSIAVCTSATRPTGGSRFTGLVIYETDTKMFWVWNGTIWVYTGGVLAGLGAAHPGSPPEGMLYWDTDYKNLNVYNGVRFDAPWNLPWGHFVTSEQGPVNEDHANNAENIIAHLDTSIAAVAHRLYRVTAQLIIRNFASARIGMTLKLKEGSTLLDAGTTFNIESTANFPVTISADVSFTTNGTRTFHVTGQSDNAAGYRIAGSLGQCKLTIDDIGNDGNDPV